MRRGAALTFAALTALAGACSRTAQSPELARTAAVDSGARPRWPKTGRVSGTAEQLTKMLAIPGVTVEDHGQRKLGPARWQVSVQVADEEAVEALRRLGVGPALQDPILANPADVPR